MAEELAHARRCHGRSLASQLPPEGGLADFTAEAKKGGIAGKLYYKACDDMRAAADPYRSRIYAVMHRRGVEGVPATPGPWAHGDLKNRPSSS